MKTVPWSARWVFVLACLAAFGPIAVNAFEEPEGRFAIDLPSGWELQPQTDQTLFVFAGPAAAQIVVQYLDGAEGCAQLFQSALDAAKTTLKNLVPEGKLTDLMVNGHPSQWEVLAGTTTAPNGVKVRLYALLGGVMLRGGGVAFQSYLHDGNRKTIEGIVKSAFATIRLPGEPVTGATDRIAAATEPRAEVSDQRDRTFSHELVTLELPTSWKSEERPKNFEKEIVGYFVSDRVPGANLFVVCYKGLLLDKSKVFRAAKLSAEGAIPNCQPTMFSEDEKTARGKPITVMCCSGTLAVAGSDVTLSALTATTKGKQSWVNLIMTRPGLCSPETVGELTRIARSVV
jgi:hypothetical protein